MRQHVTACATTSSHLAHTTGDAMGLKDELEAQVKATFGAQWSTRKGTKVPDPENLAMGNDAVEFDRATVLYADLSGSTALVDSKQWWFAGEIYKNYLYCAGRIIRSEGGEITSYDGDRVMAVFVGDTQTTPAVRCGLKINYAVQNIINPALKAKYSSANYAVKQVVGIDTSPIRASRTGVRGDNDIVWIGRAANHAAKLTELDRAERTWVTVQAYNHMLDEVKENGSPKRNMWTKYRWNSHDNSDIYGSTWTWTV